VEAYLKIYAQLDHLWPFHSLNPIRKIGHFLVVLAKIDKIILKKIFKYTIF